MVRTAWWLVLACCSVLAACAGDLENPERFEAPSTGPSCELDVMADIIEPKCGIPGCHAPADNPAAGLDLISEGQAARMVGAPAGTEAQGGVCDGRVRIDPADPGNSLLIEKVLPSPSCGSPMPIGGSLSEEEVECMIEWAEELVAMGGGGGDGGVGGDGGAGGGDDAGAGDADGSVTADGGV